MTTLLADLHFAPTPSAADRLIAEGVRPESVHLTGNTVVDALRLALARQDEFLDPRLRALDAGRRSDPPVIVVTAHRRESWGAPLARVAQAVEVIARTHPEATLVVSLHPNPLAATEFALVKGIPNVILTSPLPYGEFVRLMARASLILTDSGGIRAAAFLGTRGARAAPTTLSGWRAFRPASRGWSAPPSIASWPRWITCSTTAGRWQRWPRSSTFTVTARRRLRPSPPSRTSSTRCRGRLLRRLIPGQDVDRPNQASATM